jgi:hypothetical protein
MQAANASHADALDAIPSIKAMEEALLQIFQSSFDADSKACLVTLMKVLDNVLHKPGDDRVRTIRLSNAAFHGKVGSRPGGIDFLLACGFCRQAAAPALLSSHTDVPTAVAGPDDTLYLSPELEKTSRLVTARRLLMRRAVEDLHVREEELPPFREPPRVATLASTAAAAAAAGAGAGAGTMHNTTAAGASFNPYVGQRYDAKSAAVGTNLGPASDYISPTDAQLQILQRQQAKLEQQAARKFRDREWKAWAPGEAVQLVVDAASSATTTASAAAPKSDSALLAQRAQRLEASRREREQGGFTTAAMRQVAKLKTKKVYSHVQLTIQFADQSKLTGKFLPKEKISHVLESLRNECLLEGSTRELDLYVAPPRRLLPPEATLEQEGLVPAAKMFASWRVGSTPTPGEAFLRAPLFDKSSRNAAAFPSGQPIVAKSANADNKTTTTTGVPKKAKKESREDAMLRRMLGKK